MKRIFVNVKRRRRIEFGDIVIEIRNESTIYGKTTVNLNSALLKICYPARAETILPDTPLN